MADHQSDDQTDGLVLSVKDIKHCMSLFCDGAKQHNTVIQIIHRVVWNLSHKSFRHFGAVFL